jgi:hypothetical protein
MMPRVGNGYTLDPAVMTTVATDLADTGSTLAARQGSLRVTPDAGASSTEVSQAFVGLASALAALAAAVSDVSGGVTDAVADYRASDQQVQHGFSPAGPTAGPRVGPS